MKISRPAKGTITIELSGAEARVLLEELSDVPRGSKLPKVKQMYEELYRTTVLVEQINRNSK